MNLIAMQDTMSSREIAELTGKRHADVIRDVRTQLFTGLHGHDFSNADMRCPSIQGLTVVRDDHTKLTKEILLDREHTLTLITGYDVKSRHAINKRWLELEAKTQKPMSIMEMIIASATQLIAIEAEQERQALAIKSLEAKQAGIGSNYGFYSIAGYANLQGRKVTLPESAQLGKAASLLSKKYGIQIGKAADPRFGQVGVYHEDVLREIFHA